MSEQFFAVVHDVDPNTLYGEFVAAAYEAEQAVWETDDPSDDSAYAYALSADQASQDAWDRMTDRKG